MINNIKLSAAEHSVNTDCSLLFMSSCLLSRLTLLLCSDNCLFVSPRASGDDGQSSKGEGLGCEGYLQSLDLTRDKWSVCDDPAGRHKLVWMYDRLLPTSEMEITSEKKTSFLTRFASILAPPTEDAWREEVRGTWMRLKGCTQTMCLKEIYSKHQVG